MEIYNEDGYIAIHLKHVTDKWKNDKKSTHTANGSGRFDIEFHSNIKSVRNKILPIFR